MNFGSTVGKVGQQGSKIGNVAVGNQLNKSQKMSFGSTAGNVGQQGSNMGNVAFGNQGNKS